MAKKEIVTEKEILRDIINSIKKTTHNPKSRMSRRAEVAMGAAAGIAVVAIELIYPLFVLWMLLGFLLFIPAYLIVAKVRLSRKIKAARVEDYEIILGTLAEIDHEHYRVKRGYKWYSPVYEVNNYTLKFEDGGVWCVPKDNYPWSVERPMSDMAICQASEQGDSFIIVRKKIDGKIAVAYPENFFDFRVVGCAERH